MNDFIEALPHFRGEAPIGAFFSLFSAEPKPVTLFGGQPAEIKIVRTGLQAALPRGYALCVFPVPALMHQRGVSATPFTLTSESFGEIKVVLNNISDETFIVFPGDRVADAIIVRTL